MKEKVSFKKILLNKKNKDTIRDISKKENLKSQKLKVRKSEMSLIRSKKKID